MAQFDTRYSQPQAGSSTRAALDEGLRTYMLRVYNYVGLGVAATAVVSMLLVNNPELMRAVALGPMKWVLFFGVLGLGWFAPKLIFSQNSALAHVAYWGYCALWGAMMSPMIYLFLRTGKEQVVFKAFLITAVTFGATSLYGYVTKRSLSTFATFFMIATIGLIIAMLVNALFVQSSMMSLIVSCVTVLIFAGITAYETQEIKEMYYGQDHQGVMNKKAIFGAFMLYGSFVTLFVHILNILGIMGNSND
jgi:uncharacterized protein